MIIIAKLFVLEVCLCFTGDCDNNSQNICFGSMFVFYRGL